MRSSMLHGRNENVVALPSNERLGVDDIAAEQAVLRKDDVKLRVQGKTWKEDCQARKLNKEDAVEG